jgi:predicted  nucleic acid-binding Zn-ribbon protein
LLPYIEQRDAAAAKAANMCSALQTANNTLAELEVKCLRTRDQNIKLATEILEFSKKAHQSGPGIIQDARFKEEIAALEGEMKTSRRKWRVIKGAASAIVAGSGIDWVRESRLRDLVLDSPD